MLLGQDILNLCSEFNYVVSICFTYFILFILFEKEFKILFTSSNSLYFYFPKSYNLVDQ